MCKGSMAAAVTRDPNPGERLILYISEGGLPAFRRPADPPDCVTCIQNGHQLLFSDASADLQRELGIDHVELATFFLEGNDTSDQVRFNDGRIVDLWDFFGSSSAHARVTVTYIGAPTLSVIDTPSSALHACSHDLPEAA